MGSIGTQEMVVIFVLALLFFGPKKLPELGRTVAKAMGEFRRASAELKSTFDREMNSLERETESLRQATSDLHNDIQDHSYTSNYDDSSYYDSNYYGGESSHDSTQTSSSTVSASAIQGAETPIEQAAEAASTEPVLLLAAADTVAQTPDLAEIHAEVAGTKPV